MVINSSSPNPQIFTAQQSTCLNHSHNSLQSALSIPNPYPNPDSYPFTPSVPSFDPHSLGYGIDPHVNSDLNPSVLDNPVDKIPFFIDPNRVYPIPNWNWTAARYSGARYSTEENPFGSVIASPRSDIVMERGKISQTPEMGARISKPNEMEAKGPVWCELCDLDWISWFAYQTQLLVENHKRMLREKYISNFIQSQQTDQDGVTGGGGAVVPGAKNLNQKVQKLAESGMSSESLRICELCNVACTDEIAFASHLAGKKHKAKAGIWCEICKIKCHNTKMLQIHKLDKQHLRNLIALAQTQPIIGEQSNSDRPDLQVGAETVASIADNTGGKHQQETKNPQTGWCEVCKINCDVKNLENHKPCREHQKNLVKEKNPKGDAMAPTETHPMSGVPSSSSSPPSSQTGAGTDAIIAENTGEKDQQETKHLQTEWCEVCKINFGIKIPESHILGKKHKKNLLKQKNPEGDAITQTETQPVSREPSIGCGSNTQNLKRKRAPQSRTPEELELKRRKMLEAGTQADAIRICHICNVISNNERVFNGHLASQKHASRVLIVAAAEKVPTEPLVSAAAAADGCIMVEPGQE